MRKMYYNEILEPIDKNRTITDNQVIEQVNINIKYDDVKFHRHAIKDYLKSVLSEGTGTAAKPKTVSAAGKTATAQTGKYVNGVEICQGWFCGFFPAIWFFLFVFFILSPFIYNLLCL